MASADPEVNGETDFKDIDDAVDENVAKISYRELPGFNVLAPEEVADFRNDIKELKDCFMQRSFLLQFIEKIVMKFPKYLQDELRNQIEDVINILAHISSILCKFVETEPQMITIHFDKYISGSEPLQKIPFISCETLFVELALAIIREKCNQRIENDIYEYTIFMHDENGKEYEISKRDLPLITANLKKINLFWFELSNPYEIDISKNEIYCIGKPPNEDYFPSFCS